MEPVEAPSSSRSSGYAKIALASAAGVIVASRLSRPVLLTAAGLALAWWNKRRHAPPPSQPEVRPERQPVQETVRPEPDPLPALPTSAETCPSAPERAETPVADAWDDLRAALSPSLPRSLPPTEPLPTLPESEEPPAEPLNLRPAPAMPEMQVFPPLAPLLDEEAEGDEAKTPSSSDLFHFMPQPASSEPVGQIPDEICLPVILDEQTGAEMPAPDFIQTEQPAPPAVPGFTKSFISPFLLSEQMPQTISERVAQAVEPPLQAAPEIQVAQPAAADKKSFFDWLRS